NLTPSPHNLIPMKKGSAIDRTPLFPRSSAERRPGASAPSVLLSVAGEEALIRLVCALCHVGDDGADLGYLTDIAFIGRADILGLVLDRFGERPGRQELPDRRGARLEGMLGIVSRLGGESLQALADLAGTDQGEVDVVAAHFLEVFEIV